MPSPTPRNRQRARKREKRLRVFAAVRGLAVFCYVVVSTHGCAVIPLHATFGRAPLQSPVAFGALRDFVGVIHIHTAPYSSDASGTLAKAIRVANSQGLDYLLITEHNTMRGFETGREGLFGRTLVLIGEEISTPDGHYLALNIPHHVSRFQPTRQIIDEVAKLGGMGFVPHPFWAKKRWTRWDEPKIAGMEIYNVAHDAEEENHLRLLLSSLFLPDEWWYSTIVDRPYDALHIWDELTQQRRFVGIGGADAHEIQLLWMTLAPYELLFRMVRTHLIAPALTPEALYAALRDGHAYIGLELAHPASGFTFVVKRGDQLLGLMGDEVPWEPELTLEVHVPHLARILLLRQGSVIATTHGTQLIHRPDQPGVYRVEVELQGKPWIFSNPIYLRSSPE